MNTYVVAASAVESTRYIRLLRFDDRTTQPVLWPGELAVANPSATRIVFLRGWSASRPRAEVERFHAVAARLREAGALVFHDEVDDDIAFRLAGRRALRAA